ncbi:PAS domain-containing sensor histidine kinase [Ferruginibacter lapsinanis]|uniref:PAS domain-containing sensor histidine kinase n=1 Tax=Ferruginibacter lapsinanis TaxID=563172 RepID=UPI001E34BB3B|nr:PAS domain-containing sensor histidine kinase [Ferruginibacter lapsinanis]UEG50097.1 PAS domain-containing sensor histidine kinase [Ferruginibacter lapsinanis]
MSSTPELELLKEKERFEALFQYASLGILVANKAGEIVLANNFLLSKFGYDDPMELAGEKIEKLIPARFHRQHVPHRDKYIEHPQKRPMGLGLDLFGIKKDGTEFPVEISLSNYTTNDGDFVIAFISDITKRKEIEMAVIQQKQELAEINLQIEKMNDELEQKVELRTKQLEESKDELAKALSKEKELSDLKTRFVSMASHEFRTPLSTILSSASLVAKYTQGDEQEKRDKHIVRIKSAVSNLNDILNEFLSIGKIEDGKVVAHHSRFNIKELITTIVGEIQGIAKHGQHIQYTHIGSDAVELDVSLLRNIIINLLSNAIKFSPENGTINIVSRVDDTSTEVSIQDSGIGISKDDQEHLFERFFRGANVTNIQGTGLGLHIVGKYIELMDGQITVASELEKGTTFTFTFKNNL